MPERPVSPSDSTQEKVKAEAAFLNLPENVYAALLCARRVQEVLNLNLFALAEGADDTTKRNLADALNDMAAHFSAEDGMLPFGQPDLASRLEEARAEAIREVVEALRTRTPRPISVSEVEHEADFIEREFRAALGGQDG